MYYGLFLSFSDSGGVKSSSQTECEGLCEAKWLRGQQSESASGKTGVEQASHTLHS